MKNGTRITRIYAQVLNSNGVIGCSLPSRQRRLGVDESFPVTPVATLFDARAGVAIAEEAGMREQNVGHEETDRLRNLPCFIQIRTAAQIVAVQPAPPLP